MNLARASGILLHPTSLPNGVLDEDAYRFVDWLAAAGQRWWQVLPLGPPEGITGSPYMSPSAFAGSPELIADREATRHPHRRDGVPGAERVLDRRLARPRRLARGPGALRARVAARCAPTPRERGVRLFGDIPIYVADGSADHRAHPRLFRVGEVAGVPPDSFADDRPALGQPALRLDGDARRRLPLVDRAPAPHVRARRPDAHRPLPRLRLLLGRAGGRTRPRSRAAGAAGPALEPLPRARGGARRAAGRRRGSRRDHRAGDVGCGASSACPGWSCSSSRSASDPTNPHLPQNHQEQSVVYTGTHDNDTTRGWWESPDGRAAHVVGARPRRPGTVADRGRRGPRGRRSRSRRCRTCSRSAARRG